MSSNLTNAIKNVDTKLATNKVQQATILRLTSESEQKLSKAEVEKTM